MVSVTTACQHAITACQHVITACQHVITACQHATTVCQHGGKEHERQVVRGRAEAAPVVDWDQAETPGPWAGEQTRLRTDEVENRRDELRRDELEITTYGMRRD